MNETILAIALVVVAIYVLVGATIGWWAVTIGWKHRPPSFGEHLKVVWRAKGVFAFFTFGWLPFFGWAATVTWVANRRRKKAIQSFLVD